MGYSPRGSKGLDTTEQLHFHFSLSFIGEGNGNPLQYSCLENPMDGGAWWATVHGVAKSRARLSDFTWRTDYKERIVFGLTGEMQPSSLFPAFAPDPTDSPGTPDLLKY